jgi:flagellar biosynthesis protein FliP
LCVLFTVLRLPLKSLVLVMVYGFHTVLTLLLHSCYTVVFECD